MNRRDLMRFSSMEYWLPLVEEVDNVESPDTVRVELEDSDISEGETPFSFKDFKEGVAEVGGTPVFVRTDQASHKHFMEKASKVQSLDKDLVEDHVAEVLFHNISAGFTGLPFNCLYVREWLNLSHEFKAFKGTPIAEELRFFIHDGEVLNSHFYWPKESIKFLGDEVENWESKYRLTRNNALDRVHEARDKVERVAEAMHGHGFWSVDVACTETGEWHVIDMARGEISWHPRIQEVEKDYTSLSSYEDLYDIK